MTSGSATPDPKSGFSMAWRAWLLLLVLISLSLLACTRETAGEVPVEVVVEKEVEVPVEVVVVREVEVPVEVVVVREVEVPVEVVVVREVEVPVEVVVVREVEVPVEVVVVREVEVPVEVVVVREVEVPVEVVVEVVVTPTPASQENPKAVTAPDTNSNINNVLLVRPSKIAYSQLSALGFAEGIPVTVVTGAAPGRDLYQADDVDLDNSKFQGVFVAHTPSPGLLRKIHAFVYAGGNAAVFLNVCLAADLQNVFGFTCATFPRDSRVQIGGPGKDFAPFWDGLNIHGGPYMKSEVQILLGQSDFTCIPKVHDDTGEYCAAIYGKLAKGNVIFMIGDWAEIGVPGYPHYAYASSIFSDSSIHDYDHKEAASRLLRWLIQSS